MRLILSLWNTWVGAMLLAFILLSAITIKERYWSHEQATCSPWSEATHQTSEGNTFIVRGRACEWKEEKGNDFQYRTCTRTKSRDAKVETR